MFCQKIKSARMPRTSPQPCFVIILLLGFLLTASAARADQPVAPASGDYQPTGGDKVHWEINGAHTLIWGGNAYIPVGGIFQPRVLASAAADTDENWNADVQDLKTLKAHGVTQLILSAGGASRHQITPITAIPAATLQRVLDYLDQNGFTYGLDLNAFPAGDLGAITVNPSIYRQANPDPGDTVTIKPIDGLKSAHFFLASSHDGTIVAHGITDVQNDTDAVAHLPSDAGGDATVLLVFPTRIFDANSLEATHCPDIWKRADSVRDDLLQYLSRIHFGAGLRFFVDPLRDDLGFYGQIGSGMIPDSDMYRLQFETWLRERYTGRLSAMERAWGVKNEDLPDFATCARSIPLWLGPKGVQTLYDPQADKFFDVNAAQSVAWEDIRQFQADSMQTTMNGFADALKNAVADVPVIYRWSQTGTLTQNRQLTGFDGLMVNSPLHGDPLTTEAAAYALSDVERARRDQWLIASLASSGGLPPTGGEDSAKAAHTVVGYGTVDKLATDRTLLTDVGVRGMYVDALRRNSPQPGVANLLDVPAEQLDWIHAQESSLSLDAASMSEDRPAILFYPSGLNIPGTHVVQFSGGVWWLPSDTAATRLDIGPHLDGYSTTNDAGAAKFVIYSISGQPEAIHVKFGKDHPFFQSLSKLPIKVEEKKGITTLMISSEPLIISGIKDLPLPEDAVADETQEVGRLLDLVKESGASTDIWTQRLYYIQNNPLASADSDPKSQYELLRSLAEQLRLFLNPYVWIEAEAASQQSFGAIITSPEASGGAYLWLDSTNPPPNGAYKASYPVHINAPGDYDVWASIGPVASDGFTMDASPFTVSVNDGTQLNADRPTVAGTPFNSFVGSGSRLAGQFVWARLVSVHLVPGDHTITISVANPSRTLGRWVLGIDSFCLSRGDFHPDGAHQPQM